MVTESKVECNKIMALDLQANLCFADECSEWKVQRSRVRVMNQVMNVILIKFKYQKVLYSPSPTV